MKTLHGYGETSVFALSSNTTKNLMLTIEPLIGIAITSPPTKTTYLVGESFKGDDMVVRATYSGGSGKAVTGYTVSPFGALKLTADHVTISYTEGSMTKTATQVITVSSGDITGTVDSTKATNEIAQAKDGNAVIIPMKGTTTIPKDILAAAKGKDIDTKTSAGSAAFLIPYHYNVSNNYVVHYNNCKQRNGDDFSIINSGAECVGKPREQTDTHADQNKANAGRLRFWAQISVTTMGIAMQTKILSI